MVPVLIFRRHGNTLVALYASLVDAQDEITERIIRFRSHWNRTQTQLELVERIWPTLTAEHQEIQQEILNVLVGKLNLAKDKLSGLVKRRKRTKGKKDDKLVVKRWKYLFLKSYLDDTIKSLSRWQKTYDPSWFLIMRLSDPIIDQGLKHHLATRAEGDNRSLDVALKIRGLLHHGDIEGAELLSREGLSSTDNFAIPYSSARYVRRIGAGEANKWVIVDPIPCLEGADIGTQSKDVRTLATKLHHSDPGTFGVLKCRGVVKDKEVRQIGRRTTTLKLIFECVGPEGPRTLRKCLAEQTPISLNERMSLATQLAKAVSYVHTLDFVHKNIRPENFIGFSSSHLGSFFLIGFEQVRSADGLSYLQGDTDWHKNLYRHPLRQGPFPSEAYRMQHDMYSLGVCLLEIGLWNSFVLYGDDGNPHLPNTDIFGLSIRELETKGPNGIKNLLVEIARRELPRSMGEIYQEVVVNCLTCLDEDNEDFGNQEEFADAEGIAVGVRYIEKVRLMPHAKLPEMLTFVPDPDKAEQHPAIETRK